MKRFFRLLPLFVLLVVGVWFALPHASVLAQTASDTNLADVATTAGLQAEDPRIVVARLIRAALGFLGVVAVCIVLYGGWLWMTAGGSSEQVERARRVLVNGVIGLVIILLSVGIVSFVMKAIGDATGFGGGAGGGFGGGGPGLGGGRSTRFEVTGVAPTGAVPIRNVRVQITFTAPVDKGTAEAGITVSKMNGDRVNGELSVQGNRVTFTPADACPEPNGDRKCFAENTEYEVVVAKTIRSTGNRLLDCSNEKCTARFTSGEKIDVADPVTTLIEPGDGAGVPDDSFVSVQSQVKDEAGVAIAEFFVDEEFLDAVPAGGDNPLEAVIAALWDTTRRELGDLVVLSSVGYDFAGNTSSDASRVRVRGPWCFNGVIDADHGEVGIDCGGDSASREYCGACEGTACTADEDCGAGGICDATTRTCVVLPKIDSYTPPTGAPGTFVTVRGSGFGASGTVSFSGPNGALIAATAPSCAAPWSATEVTVMVPAGSVPGPITLTTAKGSDATNGGRGPILPDFQVNGDQRPNLCAISPKTAAPQDALALTGERFGAAREDSFVLFSPAGVTANSYSSWDERGISATVPSLQNGTYGVSVTVNDFQSNQVSLRVEKTATQNAPQILGVAPNPAPPGQYVTISGKGFGEMLGTVWFVNSTDGVKTAATPKFPKECDLSQWTDGQIATVVPDKLAPGMYTVYVERSDKTASAAVPFTVSDGQAGPNVCAILPGTGLPGAEVKLVGGLLGDGGEVIFSAEQKAETKAWKNNEITASVPAQVQSGPVVVRRADGKISNPLFFTVGSTAPAAAAPKEATYAWSFSTGPIPVVPEVVRECSDNRISAVPSSQFAGGDAVCAQAVVYAEFTTEMNPGTLDDALKVERCTGTGGNRCGSTEEVAGSVIALSTSVTFRPDQELLPETMYQVTITKDAKSLSGIALENEVNWTFTTAKAGVACTVSQVTLSKHETILDELGQTAEIIALPRAGCVVLDRTNFLFDWQTPESFAEEALDATTEECTGSPSACLVVRGLAEGTGQVRARERRSQTIGDGILTVNVADPFVTEVYPNCTEACRNAEVGASFNVAMNKASVERGVTFEKCTNELCNERSAVPSLTQCVNDVTGKCRGFHLLHRDLEPGAFYRVHISSSTVSESGAPLTRLNYGTGYVFTFRVREDQSLCAVSRVSISPETYTSHQVGERLLYTADAFGAPDACSVSGQRLISTSYNWDFEHPIADENNDGDVSTRVAAWYAEGRLDTFGQLTDDVPVCSASCVPLGAQSSAAVCGDGSLSVGEECEDGNVRGGDGCSASCLREGAGIAGVCGDGAIQRLPSGGGEDCDDGNTVSGDGCSATCLAEGSRSVATTCGNGDLAQFGISAAGEECDDGNTVAGDGCSPLCLHEGSPTLVELSGALCGNARVEAAEECDDGNATGGDGCSSRCLFEGQEACGPGNTTACCGNGGAPEVFEACDDGNTKNGDGCSNRCLLEGSSSSYATPSYCGDGIKGTGEALVCESGAQADGRIDPRQFAEITSSAVKEVDVATQQAVATIRATTADRTGEATLTLQCSARRDSECTDPEHFGLGAANCCMPRPTVALYPQGENICRNAALYADFSQTMDLSSLQAQGRDGAPMRFYALLDTTTTGGICPQNHLTGPTTTGGIFERIRSVLGIAPVRAAEGDCYAPIRSLAQVPAENGASRVYALLSSPLAPNARYTVVVEGDPSTRDLEVTGVRAEDGAALLRDVRQQFVTADTVCGMQEVGITDHGAKTPYFFSQMNEEHQMRAAVYSYGTGIRQEITPIPGLYTWEYRGWSTDDQEKIFRVLSPSGDQSRVRALGDNGDAVLSVSAHVTEDTLSIGGLTDVTGTADLTAFLCENPWPNPKLGEAFPWKDQAVHVSTYYCRDGGVDGPEGDLPALSAVQSPLSQVPDVLDINGKPVEYLLRVPDTGDAIGLRFFANPGYLTPEAWYKERGFSGSPADTEVDGFRAARDGRSTYVAVPNLADDQSLYSNIALLSFNQDTSADLESIYEQVLENTRFARNLSSRSVCLGAQGETFLNADGLSVSCTDDAVCLSAGAAGCANVKAKVTRDLERLQDVVTLRQSIMDYSAENGSCSATTTRLCSSAADCPVGEQCVGVVPELSAGTFVRGNVSSAWTSWDEVFGGQLGATLPKDPLNRYVGCGLDPYGNYDPSSCVSKTDATYVCPVGSLAYHYRTLGQRSAEVRADLESQIGRWASPIDDGRSPVRIVVGNSAGATAAGFSGLFCTGRSLGGSTGCGDGVVGAGEVCESGERGGTAVACDRDGDGANDGVRTQVCNATCNGWVDDGAGTCVAPSCGDGVRNGVEECDDGANNGRYGFCGADCTRATGTYCGDGQISGGEVCDCGSSVDGLATPLHERRAFGGGFTCANVNGAYASVASATCAWDCKGAAGFCGNNQVDGGETCDGTAGVGTDTYNGAVCTGGSRDGQSCNPGSCPGGTCGRDAVDQACAGSDTRHRACSASCQTADWGACMPTRTCGNGVVETGEACDDGNVVSTDGCTATCALNICGDGLINPATEQCDLGAGNGGTCQSEYGASCSSCSPSCRLTVVSGAYCGDGIRNGQEYCDAGSIPTRYFNATTREVGLVCATLGAVNPANTAETCVDIGMCNGGAANGSHCNVARAADICGAGIACVPPVCNVSCMSSCPTTTSTVALGLTANMPGARPETSISLHSYSPTSSEFPNAATITVPACRVATGITADIRTSNIDRPDVYVVFVTDRSGSMDTAVGATTRMQVVKDALQEAVGGLYDQLGTKMHIALVSYSNRSGQGICVGAAATNAGTCDSNADCAAGATCEMVQGFVGPTGEADLLGMVDLYKPFSSTKTDLGLQDARALLDGVQDGPENNPNQRIVVLLTDGDADDATLARTAANALKGSGYQLYTIGVTTSTNLVRQLNGWSSNGPANWDGNTIVANPPLLPPDYSYNGTTADQVTGAYSSIIDAITGFSITLVGDDGVVQSVTSDASGSFNIPLPNNFRCNEGQTQTLPLKATFKGAGTLDIFNVRMDYCAPGL